MEGIDFASPSEKDDTVELFEKKFEKAYSNYVLVKLNLKKRIKSLKGRKSFI
jgi:hypothetical protein